MLTISTSVRPESWLNFVVNRKADVVGVLPLEPATIEPFVPLPEVQSANPETE